MSSLGPTLTDIFTAAGITRAQRDERARLETLMDRRLKAAQTGDTSQLFQVAPQEAISLENLQLQRGRSSLAEAKEEARQLEVTAKNERIEGKEQRAFDLERTENTAQFMSFAVKAGQGNLAAIPGLQRRADALAKEGRINEITLGQTPEELQQQLLESRGTQVTLGDVKLPTLVQTAGALQGATPRETVGLLGTEQLTQEIEGLTEDQVRARQTTIKMIQPGAAKKLEEDLITIEDLKSRLTDVRDRIRDPETGQPNFKSFFGASARFKAFVGNTLNDFSTVATDTVVEAFGGDAAAAQEWLDTRNDLNAMVQLFESKQLRAEIGSQRTAIELEKLAGTLPNMDMSAPQFESTINAAFRMLTTAQETKSRLRQQGFNLDVGNANSEEVFTALFEKKRVDDMGKRAAELIDQSPIFKSDPAELFRQLSAEGYLTPRELRRELKARGLD